MLATAPLTLDFLNVNPSVYDAPEHVPQSPSPYFFTLGRNRQLQHVLATHHRHFLEIGRHTALDISLARLLVDKPDFALCLTTSSAYRSAVPNVIKNALSDRFGLPVYRSLDVQTCLQEAVMNAVVHGNLDIESRFTNLDGMAAHFQLIEQRLTQEPYNYRRVTITAWDFKHYLRIGITDQGKGFQLPTLDKVNYLPHGRGLLLMQSMAEKVWVDDDKRTLFLNFSYS